MRNYKKTILFAVLVGCVGSYIATQSTPKVPESCINFREEMKQIVLSDASLSALAASISERSLDDAMQERYAGMTDAQCTSALPELKTEAEALTHTKWASNMDQARSDATTAGLQCRDKRVNGDLKTHVESAQCSNPAIAAAFKTAGYPYTDLVDMFTAKRLEEAKKRDAKLMGAGEDEMAFARLAIDIAEQERKRVVAAH